MVLGYCVMAGSLFRSVPQIIKVIKHNSTEGLSLVSYLVELCCYSVVIAYNMSQVGYQQHTVQHYHQLLLWSPVGQSGAAVGKL